MECSLSFGVSVNHFNRATCVFLTSKIDMGIVKNNDREHCHLKKIAMPRWGPPIKGPN